MRINGHARPAGSGTIAVVGVNRLFAEVVATGLRRHGLTVFVPDGDIRDDPKPTPLVFLVGADRPATHVVDDIQRLRDRHPRASLALLAGRSQSALSQLARRVNADGWIPSDMPLEWLVATVSGLASGQVTESPVAALDGLTSREIEILEVISTGRSNDEVADRLGISVHTVRTHLQNIRGKLGVGSRFAAVIAARHAGVLHRPPFEEETPA